MEQLRKLRLERGLSLRTLGVMAGIHAVSLVRLEGGKFDPRLSTLRKCLVSGLIQLSILKPAAHARDRVEDVAAFLGEYPPISPVPYEKGRWDINTLSQV